VQSEYARIPFADSSVYRLPDAVGTEQAVMLALYGPGSCAPSSSRETSGRQRSHERTGLSAAQTRVASRGVV
jgi:hypothetical protein